MPTVPDGKSFLQQGGDLCLPGDFYVDELQQSDCQEGLESPGQWLAWQQWLGGGRGFGTSLLVPSLLHLCLVTLLLLLDGQDALTLLDQLHSAVRDEPDGQGADRET